MAAWNIIILLLMLLPVIMGTGLIMYHIYGPYFFGYRTLLDTLLSCVFITLGYGNPEDLIDIEKNWSLFILFIYFVGLMFFLFSAFLGMFFDAY